MGSCGACGASLYGNATYCGQCFTPVVAPAPTAFAPRAAAQAGTTTAVLTQAPAAPPWARPVVAEPEPDLAAVPTPLKVEGQVAPTVGLVLGLSLLFQVVMTAWGNASDAAPHSAIRTGLYVTLGFYALVLAVVVGRGRPLFYLPLWHRGPVAEGVGIGLFSGVATASVLLYAVKLLTGRITVAPDVKFMAGDVTPFGLLVAVAVLMVAAPVVEELLFRGFATEALRHRGAGAALFASGFAFAVWHMRFGLVILAYYTVMGAILGFVYWKRGLVASMTAHAAFNGTLFLVAVTFILGPGQTLSADGVSVRVPGGWEAVDPAEAEGTTLAAHGPSAAVFYLVHQPLPVPDLPLDHILRTMEVTGTMLPGVTVRPGTARIERYPAGEAIRMELEADGVVGELALFAEGGESWIAALEHGTGRTKADFEEMLHSLRLG